MTAEQSYELELARRQLEAAASAMPDAIEYRLAASFVRWLTAKTSTVSLEEAAQLDRIVLDRARLDPKDREFVRWARHTARVTKPRAR